MTLGETSKYGKFKILDLIQINEMMMWLYLKKSKGIEIRSIDA